MASRRKPQSLNDSHYRFLQDLTTPRPSNPSSSSFNPSSIPPPPSFHLGEEETGVAQPQPDKNRGGGDRDDSIPRFSMLSDSDSPLVPEERSREKAEIETRPRVSKVSSLDGEDTENIPPAKPEVSDIADKGNKQVKVKLQGRRRLCKISSRDGETADNTQPCDDPNFSDSADFDSPVPPKNCGGGNEDGNTNDIRDILNSLSSRLELLSIEKKRPSKDSSRADGWKPTKVEMIKDNEEADVPEYTSTGSSFSGISELPDNSSVKDNNLGGSIRNVKDEGHGDGRGRHESETNSLANRGVATMKGVDRVKVDDELETLGQSHSYLTERESYLQIGVEGHRQVCQHKIDSDADEDDCVLLSSRSHRTKFGSKEEDDGYVPLSSRNQGKELGKSRTQSEGFVNSSVVDASVDAEANAPFTLTGPRFTYKLPRAISKILYPHQVDGLKWLWSLHCQGKGGILGDDMGLGKTMQICSFLAGLFHSRLIKRVLVVTPKTLLSHWIKELSAVGLSEKTKEYFGTSAKARQYELDYILQ
ncbi:hypothetical protein CRG98_000183, partial [Punica granatum]